MLGDGGWGKRAHPLGSEKVRRGPVLVRSKVEGHASSQRGIGWSSPCREKVGGIGGVAECVVYEVQDSDEVELVRCRRERER